MTDDPAARDDLRLWDAALAPPAAPVMLAILSIVQRERGVDFRDQRDDIVRRGIARRMAATASDSPAGYLRLLERDGDEVTRLGEALVVPVSAFFRDRDVWECLEAVVLPQQAALDRTAVLRVWTAGIATGEEAWTMAMLLFTLREARPVQRVELLATDVDERSLAVARDGRYTRAAASAVPPGFRRFLRDEGANVSVSSALRPLTIFARHDLMGPALAPPEAIIASFSVVVARNLLLYFDERLREKALERLHGVIRAGGVLVLGAVESLPAALQGKFRPYPGLPEALHVYRRED